VIADKAGNNTLGRGADGAARKRHFCWFLGGFELKVEVMFSSNGLPKCRPLILDRPRLPCCLLPVLHLPQSHWSDSQAIVVAPCCCAVVVCQVRQALWSRSDYKISHVSPAGSFFRYRTLALAPAPETLDRHWSQRARFG
jgi:hypothetical protein